MNLNGRSVWTFVKKICGSPGIWLALVTVGFSLWAFSALLQLGLYKGSLAGLILGIGLLAAAAIGYAFYINENWKWKIPAVLLCAAVVLVSITGHSLFTMVGQGLAEIARPSAELSQSAVLYAYSQVPVNSLEQLNGQQIGIIERNSALNEAMIEDLQQRGVDVRTKTYTSLQQMFKALKGQALRAIILNPADVSILTEFGGMEQGSRELSAVYSINTARSQLETAASVNLERDAFTMLISVSDESLSQDSYHSVLNLLAVVNPKSAQAAILHLPRNLWVPYSNTDSEDKLGYASYYTLPVLVDTISQWLGTSIDVSVRVDSKEAMNLYSILSPLTINTWKYVDDSQPENLTQLDAPRATQYIGTRSDFTQDLLDVNAEKRQLQVLEALFDRALSSSSRLKSVLAQTAQSVETSMNYDQLCQFVKLFYLLPQSFERSYYCIQGDVDAQYSTIMTDFGSAIHAWPESMEKAKAIIAQVLAGEKPDTQPVTHAVVEPEVQPEPEENTDEQSQDSQQTDQNQTDQNQSDTTQSTQEPGWYWYDPTWQDQDPGVSQDVWYDDSQYYEQDVVYDETWYDPSYQTEDVSGYDWQSGQ